MTILAGVCTANEATVAPAPAAAEADNLLTAVRVPAVDAMQDTETATSNADISGSTRAIEVLLAQGHSTKRSASNETIKRRGRIFGQIGQISVTCNVSAFPVDSYYEEEYYEEGGEEGFEEFGFGIGFGYGEMMAPIMEPPIPVVPMGTPMMPLMPPPPVIPVMPMPRQ
ncbi:hypothetical protein TYRP_012357 [Tyrophagus putrescentiae]|nr:hypothetical protein TYRP_012357 [Tyrophagus putrescentiae]